MRAGAWEQATVVPAGIAGQIGSTADLLVPKQELSSLVRQAKLGGSCRVKVPVGQGLATHPYRVLRGWRSGIGGLRPAVQANKSREA